MQFLKACCNFTALTLPQDFGYRIWKHKIVCKFTFMASKVSCETRVSIRGGHFLSFSKKVIFGRFSSGMPRIKDKPPKSKKEFKTFVHRDDLDNQELVQYLKKKGLSFGSLKSLVEQALEKGTGKTPTKVNYDENFRRR